MILARMILGKTDKPTLGMLMSDSGNFFCYTLERPFDGIEHPCIPFGKYTVNLGTHHPGDPNGYRCPELDTSAVGRSHIQIHIANRLDELQGCIAPGESVTADDMAIEYSGRAFRRLMAHLTIDGFPQTLNIVDGIEGMLANLKIDG